MPCIHPLHVIAQRQFFRVRIEVNLIRKVSDVETANMVFYQRQRHQQRDFAGPVVIDQAGQLPTRVLVELFLEIGMTNCTPPSACPRRMVSLGVPRPSSTSGHTGTHSKCCPSVCVR
jgi:hypothetical protein